MKKSELTGVKQLGLKRKPGILFGVPGFGCIVNDSRLSIVFSCMSLDDDFLHRTVLHPHEVHATALAAQRSAVEAVADDFTVLRL